MSVSTYGHNDPLPDDDLEIAEFVLEDIIAKLDHLYATFDIPIKGGDDRLEKIGEFMATQAARVAKLEAGLRHVQGALPPSSEGTNDLYIFMLAGTYDYIERLLNNKDAK